MNDQCNTCGAHQDIEQCAHCPTMICKRCKLNHGPLCEELQKRKKRGEGPTVANVPMPPHRSGHETPPTTGPDRHNSKPRILEAPYDLKQGLVNQAQVDIFASTKLTGLAKYAEGIEHLDATVDQQIAAVKDLLNEE